ncbi:MAG: hypothetical protein R2789_14985 [Microthrixaceae bacterium]
MGEGNVLTSDDLDECHGDQPIVDIDGESVQTYHYVMTRTSLYSVSCFRATRRTRPAGF